MKVTGLNIASHNQPPSRAHRVLTMVKNERMAGSVPKWETATGPKAEITQNLTYAQNGGTYGTSESLLAYQNPHGYNQPNPDEFTFGDLIDIVNPLQHIPILNHFYREATGDDIKPIGNIIGGAIFGGPAGAAAGLVNTIIEEETGKDVTGNAVAFALNQEAPEFRHLHKPAPDIQIAQTTDQPESNLQEALQTLEEQENLTNALLAFSDMGNRGNIDIQRNTAREPITQVSLTYREE